MMPDPTPTDRERDLAIAEAITATHCPSDPRPGNEGTSMEGEIAKALAQARREGREEGIREAVREAIKAVHPDAFRPKIFSFDAGVSAATRRVERLLDQPPEGEQDA